MPFLVVAGITVPVALGSVESRAEIAGTQRRTFSGRLRSGIRARKRVWQITTAKMTRARADTLLAALERRKNLVPAPLMNVDSDEDGVVDGWIVHAHSDFAVTPEGVEDDAQRFTVERVADTGGWGGGLRSDIPGFADGDVVSAAIEMRVDLAGSQLTDPRFFAQISPVGGGSQSVGGVAFHTGDGTWQRLVAQGSTIPAEPAGSDLALIVRIGSSATDPIGAQATLWVRRVQLERGLLATAFDDNALPLPCSGDLLGGAVDCHAAPAGASYIKYASGEHVALSFELMEA